MLNRSSRYNRDKRSWRRTRTLILVCSKLKFSTSFKKYFFRFSFFFGKVLRHFTIRGWIFFLQMRIVESDFNKRTHCSKRITCITMITSDHKEACFMKTYAQKLYLDVKLLSIPIIFFFFFHNANIFFLSFFIVRAETLASSFVK